MTPGEAPARTRPAARLPSHSRQAVYEVIARAQTRGEWWVSLARVCLVAGAAARAPFLWLSFGGEPEAKLWLAAIPALSALAFSIYVLLAFRARTAPAYLLGVSVTLDAVICFLSLATNSIWPGPGYPGILALPDLGFLLVMIAGAGMRLSVPVVLLSGALNAASFAGLVALDRNLGAPAYWATDPIGIFSILLVASTGVAALIARAARRTVEEGALRALEAERAERGLGVVMQEHHDLRSMLSAAALDADLLLRELTTPKRGATGLEGVARDLREGLVRVNEHVAAIREHAYGELEVLRGPVPVSLGAVAQRVVLELGGLFPSTSIAVAEPLPPAPVLAAGGEAALSRVLHNLVCNACEGDGRRTPTHVAVRAVSADAGQSVEVAIEDDGPGFPKDVLESALEKRRTSKPDGSGLGLLIVAGLLGSQAHTLRRANRPDGGARVSFELQLADAGAAAEADT